MGTEKDLIRIFVSEDNKLGVSCITDSEEEFDMVIKGLYTLLDKTPQIVEALAEMTQKEMKTKEFILSLNNSKIIS